MACLLALLCTSAAVIYFIVEAVTTFQWRKYARSEKLRLVLDWFPQLGTDPEHIRFEQVLPWLLQGPVFDALDVTLSAVSQSFLTVLFLAFLLANDVSAHGSRDVPRVSKKIRSSVQRYIRIKTIMALLVAFLCGTFYWHAGVDLFFLFAFATFVLCYIPHVGNTIAILAPMALVFLDPSKTPGDLVTVFAVPFVVHQLSANLVEPKLLARSLDLHPVIVLLALAFWTTVWGAVGAVLSVPVTAILRELLEAMDHPYVALVLTVLTGKLSFTT